MREVYTSDIAPVVAERWAEQQADGTNIQTKSDPNGAFRAAIARELFAALPQSERDGYRERAQEEAKAARAAYDAEFKKPPSRAPEDRQKCVDMSKSTLRSIHAFEYRCIDNVGTFLAPILQGIAERTGLHSVVILGGPVPKYGGDLRTLLFVVTTCPACESLTCLI
jgi:hypothetical protein